MIRCGIGVKVQRNFPNVGMRWIDIDITEFSDDEFTSWWSSLAGEEDKFYVADALRKACINSSDWGGGDL